MKRIARLVWVILIALGATGGLFWLGSHPLLEVDWFTKDILNRQTVYQVSGLFLALVVLCALYLLADRTRLGLLNLKGIDAPAHRARLLGIQEGESWKRVGLTFAVMITLVTTVVVYFQVAEGGFEIHLFPEVPLAILFALTNSFTEEVIFRLSYATVVENEGFPTRWAEFLGAVVFGMVHYFGMAPKGLAGASMAAFIGWFLAKSIHETRGFFWAWSIHFFQDLVIFLLFFNLALGV